MGTQGLPYVIDLLDFTPRYPFVRRPMPLIERRIAHFPRIVSDTIFFIITYFYRLFGVYPFSKGISGVFSSASRKSVIKKGGVRRIQENSGESRGIQENPGEFRGIQGNSGEFRRIHRTYPKIISKTRYTPLLHTLRQFFCAIYFLLWIASYSFFLFFSHCCSPYVVNQLNQFTACSEREN